METLGFSLETVGHAARGGTDKMHFDTPLTWELAQPPLQPRSGNGQGGNGGRLANAATAPAQRPAAGEAQHG